MNNIFELIHTEEIVQRIHTLDVHSQPKWGKMNVAQMLAHCSAFQDIAMGNSFPPRSLLGVFVGRMAKSVFY